MYYFPLGRGGRAPKRRYEAIAADATDAAAAADADDDAAAADAAALLLLLLPLRRWPAIQARLCSAGGFKRKSGVPTCR